MNTSVGYTLKMASGILVVSLIVSVTVVAQAGNRVTSTWDDIKVPSEDSYVIDALVEEGLAERDIVTSPETNFFKYVMYPGDYIADSSVLAYFFPTELDIFVFILVGNGKWSMEIKDC
jgi:hypothetical protein